MSAYLMESSGRWSTAPSFDLTNSPGPGGEHYLSLAGSGSDLSLSALEKSAFAESIERRTLREIVHRTTTAVGRFETFAKTYHVHAATIRNVQGALREVRLGS